MLHIANLSFRYPGAAAAALDGVTLDIPAGSVYGLLGPNGAGKTTLIAILAGLQSPVGGQITLNGRPLAEARHSEPRAIALVPQEHAFYPMLTVAENLQFFGGVLGLDKGESEARIEQAIAFARLEQVVGKRAEQLSGGLRRRLNLAIGLLGKPKLLLLDEPTVGVDPQSRRFLLESIAGLPAAGTTVLYTSHYMEEVEAICQRVAIIDQGRVPGWRTPALLRAGERSLSRLADAPDGRRSCWIARCRKRATARWAAIARRCMPGGQMASCISSSRPAGKFVDAPGHSGHRFSQAGNYRSIC